MVITNPEVTLSWCEMFTTTKQYHVFIL